MLYRQIGGGGFEEDDEVDLRWPAGMQKPIKPRNHNFQLALNLQDWADRRIYFSGLIYQRSIETIFKKILRSGDTFIDIGANIGVLTLLGASQVGSRGKVYAFEPNPGVYSRLKHHIEINDLAEIVSAHQLALGEEDGIAYLSASGRHLGGGTLTKGQEGIEVPIKKAEEVVGNLPEEPIIVKIDVEGFEQKALNGMRNLLKYQEIGLLIEVTDAFLKRVGDSASNLYEFLHQYGFEAYKIEKKHNRFVNWVALIRSREPENIYQYDAVFFKPGTSVAERLKPLIE